MGQEGAKDKLGMVTREPTWAKKVPRLDMVSRKSKFGLRRYQA